MSQLLSHLSFASPWWLTGLLLIPALVWYYYRKKTSEASLAMTDVTTLAGYVSWRTVLHRLLPVFNIVSVGLFVLALARPQVMLREEKVNAEGIDILMLMDLSSSMLSRDFDPDRLEVSKMVAREFVQKRQHDRIGLVVFSGESYTQCPVTTDHNVIIDFLSDLEVGLLQDGTAIGMGLATAVNRLKDSKAKSRIVILLTDGVSTDEYIDPMTAAEIAKQYGVKVYCIAVGTEGIALSPTTRTGNGTYMFSYAKVSIDTVLLRKISDLTDGRYFRALDRKGLENIYAEIDRLEKTKVEVNVFKRYRDEYRKFLYLGLFIFILGRLLDQVFLRTLN